MSDENPLRTIFDTDMQHLGEWLGTAPPNDGWLATHFRDPTGKNTILELRDPYGRTREAVVSDAEVVAAADPNEPLRTAHIRLIHELAALPDPANVRLTRIEKSVDPLPERIDVAIRRSPTFVLCMTTALLLAIFAVVAFGIWLYGWHVGAI